MRTDTRLEVHKVEMEKDRKNLFSSSKYSSNVSVLDVMIGLIIAHLQTVENKKDPTPEGSSGTVGRCCASGHSVGEQQQGASGK